MARSKKTIRKRVVRRIKVIDKKVKAKVINGIIKLTDWQKIQSVFRGLVRMSNAQNWVLIPHNQIETTAVKNDLIHISQIIAASYY